MNEANFIRCIRIKARRSLAFKENRKVCKRACGDTHSFKHSILGTVAFPWNYSCPSNQPCCQVINDVTVQVGHHQNVKLVGILDQLQQSRTGRTWDVLWSGSLIGITTDTFCELRVSFTCMQQLSIIMFSYLILGYSCATSAQLCRNRPSPNFL